MTHSVEGYQAVATGAGLADRSDRHRLRVLGPDRAKFLHNLCTNEVKRLADGRGNEAFVTSPQGKTLAYVTLLACDDGILLRTDPDAVATLRPHLEKYGVFEDVRLEDVSATTFEFHLAGPKAEQVLTASGADLPAGPELSHATTALGGINIRVVRESPTGRPGLTLIGAAHDSHAVARLLHERGAASGLTNVGPETFDALRIEAGTPVFGRDVTVDNLPQEIGRDERAINFVKGCYLGQETVARIDALGHVNKLLRGLRLHEEPPPPAGSVLESAEGKRVGAVTSSAFSPGWKAPLALAYVRTTHAAPGTELRVKRPDSAREAIVEGLPMLPPL
jgi:folate-binding protein YgfZ